MALAANHLPARHGERGLEQIIVREQLRRATAVRPDVLIVGDSAALMGINARRLSEELGTRVESLATLGWVGPAGYGWLLNTVVRGSARTKTVVILMCGSSLTLEEEAFGEAGYERQVLATGGATANVAPEPLRDRIYSRIFLPVVDPPLAGRLGFYYGWPDDIARVIDKDHGTMIDPSRTDPSLWPRGYRFDVSAPVRQRLSRLADSLSETGMRKVYFGITPLPAAAVGPETSVSRERALTLCLELLRLREGAALRLPAELPTTRFATFTHLNAVGREKYTHLLARMLTKRRDAVDGREMP